MMERSPVVGEEFAGALILLSNISLKFSSIFSHQFHKYFLDFFRVIVMMERSPVVVEEFAGALILLPTCLSRFFPPRS